MTRLWLWYVDADDQQIAQACLAAQSELDHRQIKAEQALAAAVTAADASASPVTVPAELVQAVPDDKAVVAWFAAEAIALEAVFALTSVWPAAAALVIRED